MKTLKTPVYKLKDRKDRNSVIIRAQALKTQIGDLNNIRMIYVTKVQGENNKVEILIQYEEEKGKGVKK